jgi:hypothetical protein
MGNWTTADVVIMCIAAFVAVSSLVRLMLHRRNELVRELHDEAQHAKARKPATGEAVAKK